MPDLYEKIYGCLAASRVASAMVLPVPSPVAAGLGAQ